MIGAFYSHGAFPSPDRHNNNAPHADGSQHLRSFAGARVNMTQGRLRSAIAQVRNVASDGSFRNKVLRNAGWMTLGQVAEIVIRLGSSLILTRLLDPSAYGLIATVMVFMTFMVMLSDLGINAIVMADNRGEDKAFLGTLWTLQILRGFLLAALVGLLSLLWIYAQKQGWIAPSSTYANPLLPQIALLLGVWLLVGSFTSLNEPRLIRNLEQGAVARLEMASKLLTTALTLILAFLFRSVWAIALAMVISGMVRTLATHVYLSGPRMVFRLDWKEIYRVLLLSRWVAVNSLLTVLSTQADKALIGFRFGLDTLGIYSIALGLMSAATVIVGQFSSNLGVPVIRALLERPVAERKQAYYKVRLLADVYCIAAGTGMVLLGPLFFKLAYDPRYESGGIFLAFLGIKVLLIPLTMSGNFLYAHLRYKMSALIGIMRCVIYLSALALAIHLHSLAIVALCVALAELPSILLYYLLPRTNIPFDVKRDGGILALAALSAAFLFTIY